MKNLLEEEERSFFRRLFNACPFAFHRFASLCDNTISKCYFFSVGLSRVFSLEILRNNQTLRNRGNVQWNVTRCQLVCILNQLSGTDGIRVYHDGLTLSQKCLFVPFYVHRNPSIWGSGAVDKAKRDANKLVNLQWCLYNNIRGQRQGSCQT